MKRLMFLGLFAVAQCSPVFAALQDCTLTWNPNSEADLAGYHVYAQTAAPSAFIKGQYQADIPAGRTTARCIQDMRLSAAGMYNFAVTAYDKTGNESGFSQSVSKQLLDVLLGYVEKIVEDKDGATVTLSGQVSKLYIGSDDTDLVGKGKVLLSDFVANSLQYRLNRTWMNGTFFCLYPENAQGQASEQGCRPTVIGPPIDPPDTTPPVEPTKLEVTMEEKDGMIMLSFKKSDLVRP